MPKIVVDAENYEPGLDRLVDYSDVCAPNMRELIAYVTVRPTRQRLIRLITPFEGCEYTGFSIVQPVNRHQDVVAWFLDPLGATSWGNVCGIPPAKLEEIILDFIPPGWNLPD